MCMSGECRGAFHRAAPFGGALGTTYTNFSAEYQSMAGGRYQRRLWRLVDTSTHDTWVYPFALSATEMTPGPSIIAPNERSEECRGGCPQHPRGALRVTAATELDRWSDSR